MAKGDRRSARLGHGEVEKPGPNAVARYGFLDTIRRLAPEVLATLEQDRDAARWAARFGLGGVPWFVQVASASLHLWQADPQTRYVWGTLGLEGRLVHEVPAVPAWRIQEESEAEADARWAVSKRAVRELAVVHGLQKTRELRNPLYIEWLVRRVIQRWTVADIDAAYLSCDASTIQRGINEAADLVGLPRPATLTPQ